MAFGKNYVNEMNSLLLVRRSDDDVVFTLNTPEHRFKRNSEKFNWALKKVYDTHIGRGEEIMMFHILLSMQEFFDMDWAVQNVLNEENTAKIKEEMLREYNVRMSKGVSDENESSESID